MATKRAGRAVQKIQSLERITRQGEHPSWLAIPILETDPPEPGDGQAWAINVGGTLTFRVRIDGQTLSLAAGGSSGSLVIFPQSFQATPVIGEARWIQYTSPAAPGRMRVNDVGGQQFDFYPFWSSSNGFRLIVPTAQNPVASTMPELWFNNATNELKIKRADNTIVSVTLA